MRAVVLLALAGLPAGAQPQSAPAGPLTLGDVLRSVERSYPALLSALQENAIADAGFLEAQGGFDLKTKSKWSTNQYGFNKWRFFDAGVEQPTPYWGASLFSGYKRGQGNFGPWEEDLLTLSGGELRSGLTLPLFQNRAIDERRAFLRISDLQREVAEASVEKQRLMIYKAASKSYWEWVSAGRQLQVAQDLLDLATTRQQNLSDAADLGQIAPIEVTENQRAILQRQSQLIQAQLFLENTAIQLALFLRDANGQPLRPQPARLPLFPDPGRLADQTIRDDLAAALQRRPEIVGFLAKRRQLSVGRELAQNQTLPRIDLTASYSQDDGVGSRTKVGDEVKAAVEWELPFQRRKARGKLAAQEAKIEQLDYQLQFTRDTAAAEVRNFAVTLNALYDALQLVRQEVTIARQLEQAERDRFDLGDSTQFLINLRELATADAAVREIQALAQYYKAEADYRAAIANFPTP